MNERLHILIVNDKPALNGQINLVLETMKEMILLDTVESINAAKTHLKSKPVDLILLNLHTQGYAALTFLRDIIAQSISVEVVTMDDGNNIDSLMIRHAIDKGALEHISGLMGDPLQTRMNEFRVRLLTLIGMVKNRIKARRANIKPTQTVHQYPKKPWYKPDENKPFSLIKNPSPYTSRELGHATLLKRFNILAIASSTGGPNALLEIFSGLPSKLGIPVLVVQHMPPNMTEVLAESLGKKTKLSVREAVHGDRVLPDVVYLAPGGKHMSVAREKNSQNLTGPLVINLNEAPPENSVRPSADVLFRSMADHVNGNILCIVLTGMGSDGTAGISLMKQKKCYCITQSKETCVVYGMPKSVDEANLSDEKVPLDKLSHRILELLNINEFAERHAR